MGLLWILQGRRLVALTPDTAKIDTLTGSLQTYRRVPIDFDRAVVAWELASASNASQKKRNDSQVASHQTSFLLIDIGHPNLAG